MKVGRLARDLLQRVASSDSAVSILDRWPWETSSEYERNQSRVEREI